MRSVVAVVVALVVGVLCHEDGAGRESCLNLAPIHNTSAQPVDRLPYAMDVDADKLEDGKTIKVTLKMINDNEPFFEGFLVQARCVSCADPDGTILPGTFTPIGSKSKPMTCFNKDNSITHVGHEHLTTISFNWKPPKGLNEVEGVQFRAAIARNKNRWWTNIRSKELKGISTGGATSLMGGVISLFTVMATTLLK